jgi:hypothetical protein
VKSMRAAAGAFLSSQVAAPWRAGLPPAEWAATLAAVSKKGEPVSSFALRALAVLHGRDIVLLNGLLGSRSPRATLFYANPQWQGTFAGASLLYDVCPAGVAALHAWLQHGTPISATAPARIGQPMFVVYNGTNHFDAVDFSSPPPHQQGRHQEGQKQQEQQVQHQQQGQQQQQLWQQQQQQQGQQQGTKRPRHEQLPSAGAALQREAACDSFAAAVAARADLSLNPAQQREKAKTAYVHVLGRYTTTAHKLPCFMCGVHFAGLQGHLATKHRTGTGGSDCAFAWPHAPRRAHGVGIRRRRHCRWQGQR